MPIVNIRNPWGVIDVPNLNESFDSIINPSVDIKKNERETSTALVTNFEVKQRLHRNHSMPPNANQEELPKERLGRRVAIHSVQCTDSKVAQEKRKSISASNGYSSTFSKFDGEKNQRKPSFYDSFNSLFYTGVTADNVNSKVMPKDEKTPTCTKNISSNDSVSSASDRSIATTVSSTANQVIISKPEVGFFKLSPEAQKEYFRNLKSQVAILLSNMTELMRRLRATQKERDYYKTKFEEMEVRLNELTK